MLKSASLGYVSSVKVTRVSACCYVFLRQLNPRAEIKVGAATSWYFMNCSTHRNGGTGDSNAPAASIRSGYSAVNFQSNRNVRSSFSH
jgi:hypothetical protein